MGIDFRSTFWAFIVAPLVAFCCGFGLCAVIMGRNVPPPAEAIVSPSGALSDSEEGESDATGTDSAVGADSPVGSDSDIVSDDPIDDPADDPVDDPVDKPVEEPSDTPVEKPGTSVSPDESNGKEDDGAEEPDMPEPDMPPETPDDPTDEEKPDETIGKTPDKAVVAVDGVSYEVELKPGERYYFSYTATGDTITACSFGERVIVANLYLGEGCIAQTEGGTDGYNFYLHCTEKVFPMATYMVEILFSNSDMGGTFTVIFG